MRPSISLLVMGLLGLAGCGGTPKPAVVLYCAQDRDFAEQILADFEREHGLKVQVKYDTEADKSVSLFVELVQEKDRPRCDVHWNNEILNTLRLQRQGALAEYDSPAASAFPASARAKDHTWTGFAARARILLINTKLVPVTERPETLLELTLPRWKDKVVMAKPQFGTTATQAACLFEVLGTERAEAFYRGLRDNGVRVVPGNKQVAEAVGRGEAAVGLTDTDDAIVEIEAGSPVAILFPDRAGHAEFPRMGTLFLPNTVALIKGGPNPEGGKVLIDYLLSPAVEQRLAESASHQIPLNPQVKAGLPPSIERPRDAGGTVQAMAVDFDRAADLWDPVQAFLRDTFARP